MIEIYGVCNTCGAPVSKFVEHPEQWQIDEPIWTQHGNEVHAFIFKKPSSPNNI